MQAGVPGSLHHRQSRLGGDAGGIAGEIRGAAGLSQPPVTARPADGPSFDMSGVVVAPSHQTNYRRPKDPDRNHPGDRKLAGQNGIKAGGHQAGNDGKNRQKQNAFSLHGLAVGPNQQKRPADHQRCARSHGISETGFTHRIGHQNADCDYCVPNGADPVADPQPEDFSFPMLAQISRSRLINARKEPCSCFGS